MHSREASVKTVKLAVECCAYTFKLMGFAQVCTEDMTKVGHLIARGDQHAVQHGMDGPVHGPSVPTVRKADRLRFTRIKRHAISLTPRRADRQQTIKAVYAR